MTLVQRRRARDRDGSLRIELKKLAQARFELEQIRDANVGYDSNSDDRRTIGALPTHMSSLYAKQTPVIRKQHRRAAFRPV